MECKQTGSVGGNWLMKFPSYLLMGVIQKNKKSGKVSGRV